MTTTEPITALASVADVVGAAVAAQAQREAQPTGATPDAFGVLGSGNLIVTNALCAGGVRFHHARHESGAITMADGYARVSGRTGICSVRQGPWLTNTMTGLAEAAKSRTPDPHPRRRNADGRADLELPDRSAGARRVSRGFRRAPPRPRHRRR